MGEESDPQERYERQLGLLRGERISELRGISPEAEELIEKHDANVAEARRSNKLGVRSQWLGRAQLYADELVRREAQRQGERMEDLTESLNDLTQRIVRLTQVAVGVAIVGVIVAALTLVSVLLSGG
jgi:hypothetical protein